MKRWKKQTIKVLSPFVIMLWLERVTLADPADSVAEAIAFLRNMNDMRESLAGKIPPAAGEVDEARFAQVCKPVGERIQKKAIEKGWELAQISHKSRNPKNQLTANAQSSYQQFLNSSHVETLVLREENAGVTGSRIYQRITVHAGCLACHGAKVSRPNFIVSKYLEDKAFDFAVGELRGVYSAFVPSPQ